MWGTSFQSKSPYVSTFIIYSTKHVISIAIDCAYIKGITSPSWRGASSKYKIVACGLNIMPISVQVLQAAPVKSESALLTCL